MEIVRIYTYILRVAHAHNGNETKQLNLIKTKRNNNLRTLCVLRWSRVCTHMLVILCTCAQAHSSVRSSGRVYVYIWVWREQKEANFWMRARSTHILFEENRLDRRENEQRKRKNRKEKNEPSQIKCSAGDFRAMWCYMESEKRSTSNSECVRDAANQFGTLPLSVTVQLLHRNNIHFQIIATFFSIVTKINTVHWTMCLQ